MAERNLPDSLELLLDTMCNTFGGVMFITISMVIMVTAVSRMLAGASPAELDQQLLEEERRQIAKLEYELEKLEISLKLQESHSSGQSAENRAEAERLRNALREAAVRESELEKKFAQLEDVQREIAQLEEACAATEERLRQQTEQMEVELQEQERQNELLRRERESLQEEKSALRPRKIRFAKNEATSLQPYTTILAGNSVYRLGSELLSGAEVEVVRRGNILTLLPRRGVPISEEIGKAEFSRLFSGIDPNRFFIRCFMDPDSLDTFVGLRQQFREAGLKLEWVITEEFLLELVENPDYSASD